MRQKIILSCFLIILFSLFAFNVFAVTYQNTVDLSFTFGSFMGIDVSGDLIIYNLAPGTSSDSNIITVSASSNSITGYEIRATVGDSTQSYTDLRLSPSDSTNTFTSLTANAATLNAFANDKWGYSYSSDNGTTWVSGNVGSTSTGYNGLPLYTGTGVLIADTSSASTTSLKFKIGAKANASKVTGDYTNIINFVMTSKVLTTNYTLNYLPNDGNGGADVTSMPSPATISNAITSDTIITLSSANPERDDYEFLGWCDGTVTNDTCSGTLYDPGDSYTIQNTGGTTTINLSAVWEEAATGETWIFNESPECSGFDGLETDRYYAIDFESNETTYSTFMCRIGLQYSIQYNNQTVYYAVEQISSNPRIPPQIIQVWTDAAYRTITITGGVDANDTGFRTWLSNNATQQ